MSVPASFAPAIRTPVADALVWAGIALCAAGFVFHRLWGQLPAARFGESLLLVGLTGLIAWSLRRGRRWQWADALAATWLLALIALTNIIPALAVAIMAVAATALGGCITGPRQPLLALLCGLALLAGVVGWLLPLPVHHWWSYALMLGVTIVLRRHALHEDARVAWQQWRDATAAAPTAAAWSVVVLGLASAGAWLPTMQHDDLAYHLSLPWQLTLNGRYALDPSHQVWALAPWAGDVLQAVPQVLARVEGRSALNAIWLAATAAGLWRIGASLGLEPMRRWAVLALFGSLPLVAALLSGMQTETAATAITVMLAAMILDVQTRDRRNLFAAALLFGLLCALKPLHAMAALPLLGWAAWRMRDRIRWGALLPASAMTVLVAGSSYSYAWHIAGNPVLPLFNGVFRSRYFAPHDFSDARWNGGFDATLIWDLTFDTSRYLESWDGGIGFVLIALAGAWLLALCSGRTRALAIGATIAMLLPLAFMQYARYAHPGMVLLLPALVAALPSGLPHRSTAWLLAGVCVLNLAYQGNAHWILHTGGIKRSVGLLGRDQPLFARYTPERALVRVMRERGVLDGDGTVLVLDPAFPYSAELGVHGRSTAWYDPALEAARVAAAGDPSGQAWVNLLRREHVRHVLVRPASLTPAQRAGLDRAGARLQLTIDEAQWWRVMPDRTP